MASIALYGKYRVWIAETPPGSGQWFYTVAELSGAEFQDRPDAMPVGPFDSCDRAMVAGRHAVASCRFSTCPPGRVPRP